MEEIFTNSICGTTRATLKTIEAITFKMLIYENEIPLSHFVKGNNKTPLPVPPNVCRLGLYELTGEFLLPNGLVHNFCYQYHISEKDNEVVKCSVYKNDVI